jgi:hypothetical protein
MMRVIKIYGCGLESVKQQAAILIAEQEREGWAFNRISVDKAAEPSSLYTHIATVTFISADEENDNAHS